jgi:PAS domain S-box-containing protein
MRCNRRWGFSLKTRIMVVAVAILLLGIWSLALYVRYRLSMERSVVAAAMGITLVTAVMLGWMLQRSLQPLFATVKDLRQREAALRQSENRILVSQKIAGLGSYVFDADGGWSSSEVFDTLFGIDPNYARTLQTWIDLVHPDDQAMMGGYFAQCIAAQEPHFDKTYRILRRTDQSMRWMHGLGTFEYDAQGRLMHMQGTIQDVTTSKDVEMRLSQLSRITEQAPLAIVITDLSGAIEYTNPRFTQVTGFNSEEVLGINPRQLQSGLTPAARYVQMWQTLLAGHIWQGEFHNRKKNGELFIENATIAPVLNSAGETTHYVALKEDITLRKRTETALQNSLKEKVALLNEVHHRVKNNLQIVSSMLRMEAARSDTPGTKAVLGDMQSRIRSMALLHETLYRSGTFASIDLADYLKQLASQTFRAHVMGDATVRLHLDLAALAVDMDLATPCGLLVNELLTNSLKHAFAQGQSGVILVQLLPVATVDVETSHWVVRVRDDGVGLPADFTTLNHNSLGMQLIGDLARQLHGKLDIEPGPGASFAVTFAPRPAPPLG